MMLHVPICLAAVLWLALAGAAGAASPTAVVELFTSQGCSSCPPADAFLAELSKRPEVVALTFPVDYWDYLGWKDTLAHPLFTARQKAYAMARGDRQVYTPQVVVNGTKPCVGSDRSQIEALARAEPALPVTVTANERDGAVQVTINAGPERVAMAEVWILPVSRSRTVPIGKGENRGRTITYANVVRGMVRLGEWRGGSSTYDVSLRTAQGDADGYVVLLQSVEGSRPGVILGAAKSPGL
jgi:hypothetical protein